MSDKKHELKMMFQEALKAGVDFNKIVDGLETKTYMIPPTLKVPLHEHPTQDEIFYCVKGDGIGIVDDKEMPFKTGDLFIAPAGSLHSLHSDDDLFVLAFLVPVNPIICHCKQVTYIDIRKAMVMGARTLEDIQEQTGAGTGCGGCHKAINKILSMACGCKMVTMDQVRKVIQEGADTVDKIEEVTGAGSDCGNCRRLIESMIID